MMMMERHPRSPNNKRRILAIIPHNYNENEDDDYQSDDSVVDVIMTLSPPATFTAASTVALPTTSVKRRRISRPRCRSSSSPLLLLSSSFCSTFIIYCIVAVLSDHHKTRMAVVDAAPDFEPYQLNGGLVAAVAGPNFCITASDTRMIGEGGYLLSSRNHIANRLWRPAVVVSPDDDDGDDNNDDQQNLTLQLGDDLEDFLRFREREENFQNQNGQNSNRRQQVLVVPTSSSAGLSEGSMTSSVVIGSSGCSTDCAQLKLDFQADYHAATSLGQMKLSCNTDNVANLLSQTLYGRRTFPYYAFCVVGGLEVDNGDNNINNNNNRSKRAFTGKAYVYDAIGSYEQVAVASAGTGRELLQPILDRMFSRSTSKTKSKSTTRSSTTTQTSSSTTTSTTNNNLIKRQRPRLQVDCTSEEAVDILCQAYRSVSEREIGVGDTLILHVSEANNNNNNDDDDGHGTVSSRIIIVPLKQH